MKCGAETYTRPRDREQMAGLPRTGVRFGAGGICGGSRGRTRLRAIYSVNPVAWVHPGPAARKTGSGEGGGGGHNAGMLLGEILHLHLWRSLVVDGDWDQETVTQVTTTHLGRGASVSEHRAHRFRGKRNHVQHDAQQPELGWQQRPGTATATASQNSLSCVRLRTEIVHPRGKTQCFAPLAARRADTPACGGRIDLGTLGVRWVDHLQHATVELTPAFSLYKKTTAAAMKGCM